MSQVWTIKQLNEMSDKLFIQCILNERSNKLTNPYSPLSNRLRKTANRLDNISLISEDKLRDLVDASSLILDRLDEFGNIDSIREEGPIQDLRNALESIKK